MGQGPSGQTDFLSSQLRQQFFCARIVAHDQDSLHLFGYAAEHQNVLARGSQIQGAVEFQDAFVGAGLGDAGCRLALVWPWN